MNFTELEKILIAYAPSITAVLTCLITVIKCINKLKTDSEEREKTRGEREKLDGTVNDLKKQISEMNAENKKLRKQCFKILDKMGEVENDKEV